MTIVDELQLGLQTTGIGLLVTFVALIFIVIIIVLLSKILNIKSKGEGSNAEKPSIKKEIAARPIEKTTDIPVQNNQEIIAVLGAAITACTQSENRSGDDSTLIVRSYRRMDGNSPWMQTARDEQIFNKF